MLVLLLLAVISLSHSQTTKPNIVFIITDDHGYHDVGYHGSVIKTPTINRLAAGGVKLENYYVQPVCTPSRSQLMSGRYQIHTGMQHGILKPDALGGLPLDLPTLPDQLKKAGYATHMVGKWHLGFYKKEYTPTYRGFNTFFGLYSGHGDHYNHDVSGGYDLHNDQGHDLQVSWNNTEYSSLTFGNRAVEIIENHDKKQPLFLYLSFQAVHTPLQVPQEYLDYYPNIIDEDRKICAAMTTCMDDSIKNVTDALRNNGLWQNTIIVFTSDNGGIPRAGSYNYPLRGLKGSEFEGGIRAIGFVSGPGVPSQVINHELIHISDWYPTLVTLAGGSLDDPDLELDGHDVWKTIVGDEPSPRHELLHNIDPEAPLYGENLYPNIFDVRVLSSIRVKGYKLLTGNQGDVDITAPPNDPDADPCEGLRLYKSTETSEKNVWLYDIENDPSECVDLSASQPNKVLELLERLRFYNSTAVPVVVPPSDTDHSPDDTGGAWVPWLED